MIGVGQKIVAQIKVEGSRKGYMLGVVVDHYIGGYCNDVHMIVQVVKVTNSDFLDRVGHLRAWSMPLRYRNWDSEGLALTPQEVNQADYRFL